MMISFAVVLLIAAVSGMKFTTEIKLFNSTAIFPILTVFISISHVNSL